MDISEGRIGNVSEPPRKRQKVLMNRTNLFDLPLEDIFRNIAEHLPLRDLLTFGMCSHFCKYLVDKSLIVRSEVILHYNEKNKNFCNEKIYRIVLQKCRYLRKIHLVHLPLWLTDDLVSQLLSNSPFLEIFAIYIDNSHARQTDRMSDYRGITTRGVEPLLHCKNLYALKLEYSVCDAAFLRKLSLHNNQIREFHLKEPYVIWFSDITEQEIVNFFRKQPQLRYVTLPLFSNECILNGLMDYCPQLRWLYLPYFYNDRISSSDKSIRNFIRRGTVKRPKFNTLALAYNNKYEDALSHRLYQYLRRHNVRLIRGYFNYYHYY